MKEHDASGYQFIGPECKFEFFCRRWNAPITYRITRTTEGWFVEHKSINGPSDKRAEPILSMNFNQDYINYPLSLGDYFESLWERIEENDLIDVQEAINELANWTSACEENTPTW